MALNFIMKIFAAAGARASWNPKPWGCTGSSIAAASTANTNGTGKTAAEADQHDARAGALPAVLLGGAALIVLSAPAAVHAEHVRVALLDNRSSVTIVAESGLVLGEHAEQEQKKIVLTTASVGGRPVRVRAKSGFVHINRKNYRGWLEVRKKRNGLLLVINDLDIEEYLQGVVTSEIPNGWSFEALKAQAVAARTYALYQKKTSGRKPYHMLATVSSQVYDGGSGERPRGAKAVRETRGLVLMYNGEIIPAFYHSSCGGHTEDASELWGFDEPYLKGVDCDCQEISRYGLWERRIRKNRLLAALRRQGMRISDVIGINIKGITTAGRVKEVSIQSPHGVSTVPAESLRTALGTALIPSVFFELEMDGDEAVFSGRGSGHGVGLCQWGAEYMAEQGHTFRQILYHYYPGTSISRIE